ncbi:MAG TPA: hypothetical protein PLL99_01590 [Chitinophagales bacterium]|jgi:uncharacterized protein YodC (DUF2158 family)|nr:hypothetical protein [Chitinophagales bacterium]
MAMGIGSIVYLKAELEGMRMIITGKGSKGWICEWEDSGISCKKEYPEDLLTEEESGIYDILE